jgi:hypothetical protein
MRRLVSALLLAAFSCGAAAEWVIVNDTDEYIAYVDPATISRDGDRVRMSDLIDLKSPRPSPRGNLHASSRSLGEFDCQDPRMRPLVFTLHSAQMGDGDIVEDVAISGGWLPVAPGTLLDILWQFACS